VQDNNNEKKQQDNTHIQNKITKFTHNALRNEKRKGKKFPTVHELLAGPESMFILYMNRQGFGIGVSSNSLFDSQASLTGLCFCPKVIIVKLISLK